MRRAQIAQLGLDGYRWAQVMLDLVEEGLVSRDEGWMCSARLDLRKKGFG